MHRGLNFRHRLLVRSFTSCSDSTAAEIYALGSSRRAFHAIILMSPRFSGVSSSCDTKCAPRLFLCLCNIALGVVDPFRWRVALLMISVLVKCTSPINLRATKHVPLDAISSKSLGAFGVRPRLSTLLQLSADHGALDVERDECWGWVLTHEGVIWQQQRVPSA